MKNQLKRLAALVLTLCLAFSLAACGGTGSGSESGNASAAPGYTVRVVDGAGNPYTEGVIVRFMQGGTQVAMEVIGADGTVTKDLEKDDYTVELMFTDSGAAFYYDTTDLTLSADKKTLEIVLAMSQAGEAEHLNVPVAGTGERADVEAYQVSVGSTYVKLTSGARSYFLFTPAEGGTYQVSVNDAEVTVGYYGSPFFVQELNNGTEQEDGSITIDVRPDMIGTGNTGTSVLVLGVDAGEGVDAGTLNVVRIGDHKHTVSDEPWNYYQTTMELAPYVTPDGADVKEFDLTAESYDLVKDDAGYYHLNAADGPLVVVMLGEDPDYVDCFKTILDYTGVVKYFYDESGEFIKKESYQECLFDYFEVMDEDTGHYPLTDDLMYIIQQAGDHLGWYDPDNPVYIFKDQNGDPVPGINEEVSWLFMCRYIEN